MVGVEPGDASIFQLLDPFSQLKHSLAQGDVEVGHSPLIVNIAIGGFLENIFIMFDMVMESADLLIEMADFDFLLRIASGDGCKEPLGDGLEDVGIEVRVRCQGGCNGIGQHRWFRTLDRTNRERDAILGGRGI